MLPLIVLLAAHTACADSLAEPSPSTPGAPIEIFPGDNIQRAVDRNPAGVEFLIKAGVHRLQTVLPKPGSTFTGEPGAILSGARVLEAFQREGGLWVALGQTQQGPRFGPTPYGAEVCADGSSCLYPEDLFVDDVPLRQVDRISDVGPGTWYFDYQADRIYLGEDPTGRLVETSVATQAFQARSAHGLTVRGLVIEKYANPAQVAALESLNADDVLFEDNHVRLNHGAGISVCCGKNGVIRGNRISYQGQLGIGSYAAESLLVEDNEISQNNQAGYAPAWEAGGTKFAQSTGLVLRGNRVHDNLGKGLWLDGNNVDARYEGNEVLGNSEHGIFHEISYAAVITDNVVAGNGWHGIVIDSSPDVEVSHNTVTGNGLAQAAPLAQILARDTRDGADGLNGPWIVEGLRVRNNTVGGLVLVGASGPSRVFSPAADNGFDDNIYTVTTPSPFVWAGSARTVAEWQGFGNDLNGEFR